MVVGNECLLLRRKMKLIYLKSVLAFIFVGVMAMLICGLFYNDYLEQQPATPEQLTEITQDIPVQQKHLRKPLSLTLLIISLTL